MHGAAYLQPLTRIGAAVRTQIDAFRARFDVSIENIVIREEAIAFNVPRELREAGAP